MSDVTMPRPTSNSRDEWKAYWTAQGEDWRTEPEISPDRQRELAERRDTIKPNIEMGIYPFKDMCLSRADVEWLLHEHFGEIGPITINDYATYSREGLNLSGVNLDGINLSKLPLAKINLTYAHMRQVCLDEAEIGHCTLVNAIMDGSSLKYTLLIKGLLFGISLVGANLEGAFLMETQLQGADLSYAHLEGATFGDAHLESLEIGGIELPPANLEGAFLNEETAFNNRTIIGNSTSAIRIADVYWGGANLATISWQKQDISKLGDEQAARDVLDDWGEPKNKEKKADGWEKAVRAYRQLAVALRAQGMNEVADRFAYRAQLCQRRVTRFGGLRSLPSYLGSLLLDLISGYGYRPARSLATYALVIGVFALIYGLLGQSSHPLTVQESIVVSMTAFHGRGFFATSFSPGDPQAIAAAIEAFVGLFIEVTFIATFTQRFFSR